jgi:3-isopropylmalate/(R)-2-methylmalate dehydratase small subunit
MTAQFDVLTSRVVALPVDDIDTDQIIPARFLKVTDKAGLGQALFADWRYLSDGNPRPEFALNRPDAQGAEILIAGDNFGCGSSREHAPWALTGWGLRAVVARGFADIFQSNALKNGLVPVIIDAAVHGELLAMRERDPKLTLTIDLRATALRLPDGRAVEFPIDPFARRCLLDGLDELSYLLTHEQLVKAYESRRD